MVEMLAMSQTAGRETIYNEIIPQIESMIAAEDDVVASLANVAAVLKEALGFFWVGFYLAKENELVLGPFQGPPACTRIKHGEGVCGRAFSAGETLMVPDVEKFPGHIACSTASRSEIVVPLVDRGGRPTGVLDVDSNKLNDFSEIDAHGLEAVANLLSQHLKFSISS